MGWWGWRSFESEEFWDGEEVGGCYHCEHELALCVSDPISFGFGKLVASCGVVQWRRAESIWPENPFLGIYQKWFISGGVSWDRSQPVSLRGESRFNEMC